MIMHCDIRNDGEGSSLDILRHIFT